MIIHVCHPPERSCFAIYSHDVRAVVNLVAAQNVANDYLVPVDGGANTRNSAFDAVVIGDLVRPDEPTAVLLNCEEIATPIGEVNGVTIDRGSSRNITTGCEHPFRFQLFDIGWADGVLGGLAPGIV